MAQEVKTYSVYDTNQSGDLSISDVTDVVDKVKRNVTTASTMQYVTAEDLKTILQGIYTKLEILENLIKKNGQSTDEQEEESHPTFHNGYEYVDLGLSSGTLWAVCNVGASSAKEYGSYFAWGETYEQPHSGYSENTYKFFDFDMKTYSKYVINSERGDIDDNLQLDIEDDAATYQWGGNWTIPTKQQFEELISECSWTLTTVDGVRGWNVVGKSGKNIFLPGAGTIEEGNLIGDGGLGYYWSSCMETFTSEPTFASDYGFLLSFGIDGYFVVSKQRYTGCTIRPVINANY